MKTKEYFIIFDQSTNFPVVDEAIKIDKNLLVQLQFHSKPVLLLQWFTKERNAKLTRFGMPENFQQHLKSFSEKKDSLSLLKELMDRKFYSVKRRSTYLGIDQICSTFGIYISTSL